MKQLDSINQKVDEFISRLLDTTTSFLTPKRFIALDEKMGDFGVKTAPVTALLLIILGIVAAIKSDSFMIFAGSLGVVVAFFVAHWCGRALMPNCDRAVTNSHSLISSYGLFSASALILLIGFIGVFVFGIYSAIKLSKLEPMFVALAYAAVMWFFVWFLLNPSLLRIDEDPNSTPGNDALSLYLFSLAINIRLHRVLFGAGLLSGNLLIAISTIAIMKGGSSFSSNLMTTLIGVIVVFSAALSPLFLYITFVVSYLVIDIFRSILRTGKQV